MALDEQVLCIPSSHFQDVGEFHGFRVADTRYQEQLLNPAVFQFVRRADAESNSQLKQLIPYVVLRCGEQLFHYCRGTAGTEKRLTAKRSLGVGGHISEADAAGGTDPYRTGMLRELQEEVAIRSTYTEQMLGFIYDDRTPVGAVHIGIVHLFDLAEAHVKPREDALIECGFASVSELIAEKYQFETWSQFVLDTPDIRGESY